MFSKKWVSTNSIGDKMKNSEVVAAVILCAIFVSLVSVQAWNNWTPITIHEVQFDGTEYYAPVVEHDIHNNSPLLISDYLEWENQTWYQPIYIDSADNDFVQVSENSYGLVYIELKEDMKIKKNDANIGIPILAHEDPHLGENILNLPVLGNTQSMEEIIDVEPYNNYYLMIPLKNYPEGKDSYVAYLIENLDPPKGNENDHNWIIPLIKMPINPSRSSESNNENISNESIDWDIQYDLGLILDYSPLNVENNNKR
jgi:hypothetical protein